MRKMESRATAAVTGEYSINALAFPEGEEKMSLSRFAGLYRALDFAYGCFGSNEPAPLQIGMGNYATGVQSPILILGYTTLSDGTLLEPLNTNAPVQVGSGPNIETVTPSAVSDPNPIIYNGNSFTADFANPHGAGDLIASGTWGLQEALNFAAAAGGGTVIVDAGWFGAGGTADMIDDATIPSGTAILNNKNGVAGGFSGTTLTMVLNNAEVLALESAPTVVLPTQGDGTFIEVISAVLENINGGTAYTGSMGAIQLSYGSALTYPATATIAATFLTSPTVSQMIKVAGVLATTPASDVLDTEVTIGCATANPATGTGTIKLHVTYVVHGGF